MLDELDETFFLNLRTRSARRSPTAQGVGTIIDDDRAPDDRDRRVVTVAEAAR